MAGLYRIDPMKRQVELNLSFPNASDSPRNLSINHTGELLYYLNNGVYIFNISDTSLPSAPLIAGKDFNFYGLGVSPDNGDIFVSDAIDYQQKGVIYKYNSSGKLLSSFYAGIIPGGFCFY